MPYESISEDVIGDFVNVLNHLGISVLDFNKNAFYKLDLTKLHIRKFNYVLAGNQKEFKFLLWSSFKRKDRQRRAQFLSKLTEYDHLDNWVQTKSQEFSEVSYIDYENVLSHFLMQKFHLQLKGCGGDFLLPDLIFKNNVKKISLAAEIELPEEILSYLYFDDCINFVDSYLDSLAINDKLLGDSFNDVDDDEYLLPENHSNTKSLSRSKSRKNISRGGKHSSIKDKAKKESGRHAEKIVFKALVNKYGLSQVDHVSDRDDSLGYDIRYSVDNKKTWVYAEVKRYTNSRFYMSIGEMNFQKDHKESFQVFLVDIDNNISILSDIDFDDDEKFSVGAEKFIVSFELD